VARLSEENAVIRYVEGFSPLLPDLPLAGLHLADMALWHPGQVGEFPLRHPFTASRPSQGHTKGVLPITGECLFNSHGLGRVTLSAIHAANLSSMDDEEFLRHFKATYGERGERFDEPYRSAYHFAEAESSSHPQFVGKEWNEVEQEIHRDWEMSHPGTWNTVENAIHFGWDTTRRHH